MSEWNIQHYNNGYQIGQMDEDNKLHGFGYFYLSEFNSFTAGNWTHGKPNGWFLSTDRHKHGLTYFRYESYDRVMTDYGWLLWSDKEQLTIHQDTYKIDNQTYGERGLCFRVCADRSWNYKYMDPFAKIQKWILYDKQRIIIAIWSLTEKKVISKKVIIEGDYEVPFHHFHQDTTPNAKFESYADGVWPIGQGPTVQEGEERQQIHIGHLRSGSTYFNGLLYTSSHDNISIDQEYEGHINGGCYTTDRYNRNWTYSYFKDDEFQGAEACWNNKTSTLEIRKYNYGDDHTYDCIQIDKDINVTYKKAYDEQTQQSENEEYFDFESTLESKPKTKKATKTNYMDGLLGSNFMIGDDEEDEKPPKTYKKPKKKKRKIKK